MVGKSNDLRKNRGGDVYGWIYSWVSVLNLVHPLSLILVVVSATGIVRISCLILTREMSSMWISIAFLTR